MRKRRLGFTLIELLVVVAIIALLLAILVPTLSRAKRHVREVICRSNLRQLAIGYTSYAAESNGFLPGSDEDAVADPGAPHGYRTYSWLGTHPWTSQWGHGGGDPEQAPHRGTLFRYCGRDANVYKCPEDRIDSTVHSSNESRTKVLYSYTAPQLLSGAPMNLLMSTLAPRDIPNRMNILLNWTNYSGVARRSQPWMIVEEDAVYWLNFNTSAGWSNEDSITDRHNGRGSVAYVDGSVDTRKYPRGLRRMFANHVFYDLRDGRLVEGGRWPVLMGGIRDLPDRFPDRHP